jgi:uncharacterized protein (DUF697 family)
MATKDDLPASDAVADAEGSRLLHAVKAMAISPSAARELVATFQAKAGGGRRDPPELQDAAADLIVKRYAKLAATSGGITALAGVVPGVGTAVSMLGGGMADAVTCMKLQVDMVMCLAVNYGYDVGTEEGQHLAFLIAAGGTLEKAGKEVATKVGSEAGVRLVRQLLKGAVLKAVKELFKRLGIIFTRKALEKAIPFGIGVVIGSTANYALTKYVGAKAKQWFVIDRETPDDDGAGHQSAGRGSPRMRSRASRRRRRR